MSTVQSTEPVRDLSFSLSARAPEGITLSPSAAQRLAQLSQAEGHKVMLRVAVEGGGCSGFQYQMDLVQTSNPDDLVVSHDGYAALIDPVSVPFLKGSVVDYVDELAGAQFAIKNPNAASSCGCGVSFSI